MRLNNGFYDGKPQPGAIAFALTRRIDTVEAVKQSGKVLSRNFHTRVLDRNGGFISLPGQ